MREKKKDKKKRQERQTVMIMIMIGRMVRLSSRYLNKVRYKDYVC